MVVPISPVQLYRPHPLAKLLIKKGKIGLSTDGCPSYYYYYL